MNTKQTLKTKQENNDNIYSFETHRKQDTHSETRKTKKTWTTLKYIGNNTHIEHIGKPQTHETQHTHLKTQEHTHIENMHNN